MKYDGAVVINTDIDLGNFKKGLGKLSSMASAGITAVVGVISTATAAIGGMAAASVAVGSAFEKSMSQVAATMGMSAEEVNKGSAAFTMLKDAAKEAGATTQFSASQAADALNYLALAGYSAEKSVKALPTVLNLAAAGGLDLAYASDLVTDSMSALGLETDQLEGFVDKLAVTAQKSNTSVGQLGQAILTVGGTARSLSGGTTELSTALGVLADNGIKGAEGGTQLRNIILSLSAPTNIAAEKMRELGVEAFDASGNMRPLNEVFADFNKVLGDMGSDEKAAALAKIFNREDLKSVNALLNTSNQRFSELTGYIDKASGAASRMAKTMNDNLGGRLTQLKSSLEGLGIQIYESFDKPMKKALDGAIKSTSALSEALKDPDIKKNLDDIAKSAGELIEELSKLAAEVLPSIIKSISAIIKLASYLKLAQQAIFSPAQAIETAKNLDILQDKHSSFREELTKQQYELGIVNEYTKEYANALAEAGIQAVKTKWSVDAYLKSLIEQSEKAVKAGSDAGNKTGESFANASRFIGLTEEELKKFNDEISSINENTAKLGLSDEELLNFDYNKEKKKIEDLYNERKINDEQYNTYMIALQKAHAAQMELLEKEAQDRITQTVREGQADRLKSQQEENAKALESWAANRESHAQYVEDLKRQTRRFSQDESEILNEWYNEEARMLAQKLAEGYTSQQEYYEALEALADNHAARMKEITERHNKDKKTDNVFEEAVANALQSAINSTTTAMKDFFSAIDEGQNAWKAFGNMGLEVLAGFIEGIGQALISAAALSTAASLFPDLFPGQKALSAGKAAVAVAAGMAAIATAQVLRAVKFASGGIVPGNLTSGDKVLARVNSGEMVLNSQQQARLFAMANGIGGAPSGGGAMNVQVINNAAGQVSATPQFDEDALKIFIETTALKAVSSNKGAAVMASTYGAQRKGVRRF